MHSKRRFLLEDKDTIRLIDHRSDGKANELLIHTRCATWSNDKMGSYEYEMLYFKKNIYPITSLLRRPCFGQRLLHHRVAPATNGLQECFARWADQDAVWLPWTKFAEFEMQAICAPVAGEPTVPTVCLVRWELVFEGLRPWFTNQSFLSLPFPGSNWVFIVVNSFFTGKYLVLVS